MRRLWACFGLESQLETQETQMDPMELKNLTRIVSQVDPKLEIWLFQKFLSHESPTDIRPSP